MDDHRKKELLDRIQNTNNIIQELFHVLDQDICYLKSELSDSVSPSPAADAPTPACPPYGVTYRN